MRVKLFTDKSDLDGAGNTILAKMAFGDNAEVVDAYYYDLDEKIINLFQSGKFKEYDHVFITDLSIKEETAKYIDSIPCHNLLVFDHHKTALHLEQYEWCDIIIEQGGIKECGTSLFYEWLNQEKYLNTEIIDVFVELVRQYDTWDWFTNNDLDAYNLNRLYKIYGRNDFIKDILYKIRHEENLICDSDMDLINLFEKKLQDKIKSKNKTIIKKDIEGYKAGIVFVDDEASAIGHGLLELNPELDLIAMILMDYNTISFRSRSEDIDVSKIAERFGGGGHKCAAGCKFSTYLKDGFINNIL